MKFEPNALFYYMAKVYADNKTKDNQIIFCNEGGMRSSKTWDAIHFFVAFCNHNQNKGLKFYFFRKTLKDCREKLYISDFVECLKEIGIYDTNNARNEGVNPEYNLFGNKIYFRGIDSIGTEATYSDGIFYNELMDEDSYNNIAGWIDRCKKFVIFDWNPKYTLHWIFKWESRSNVYFTHTTYKNNKKLDPVTVGKVEQLSPWNLEDLHLPKDQRRPHEENVKNNTFDEWRFEVYGMGLRANRAGLVFPNVTWIYDLPSEYDVRFYGLDYGFTNDPSALTEVRLKKNAEGEKCDIYIKLLLYQPTKESDDLIALIDAIDKNIRNVEIASDSADGGFMLADLRRHGFNIIPAKKPAGSILYGIDLLHRCNIHLVISEHSKSEQENYSYMVIEGNQTNTPIDKHNHMWDSVRYVALMLLHQYIIKN